MAVEKDKVLAAIELKFKGKSITKTFKENIAAKWAAKIESEEEIDNYIDDREDVILEAVSEADRRATDAVNKSKSKQPEPQDPPAPPKDDDDTETPKWAKGILAKLEAAEAKINGFEAAQKTKSITERFKSDERLKGVPELMFKGRIPQTEEEYETAVTELATDFTTFAEQAKLTTFGKDNPAPAGKPAGGKKEASKEEIAKVTEIMGIK